MDALERLGVVLRPDLLVDIELFVVES